MGFIKRLKLHIAHVCKSKTKQQTSLSLYYLQIRTDHRVLNLLDYQPSKFNPDSQYDGKKDVEVISLYIEAGKKKA
jgi:hypothetical protein